MPGSPLSCGEGELLYSVDQLFLYAKNDLIPRFFPLLQQGIGVMIRVGCSIESLLCQQLGMSPEYLRERIQTIFLDGKPVDDVNATTLHNGSTLALSAAMPGLAGAIFRKQGFYAPLRSKGFSEKVNGGGKVHEGMITIKLFNLLLKELGPLFLSQGVLVDGKSLSNFFRMQPRDFWEDCLAAEVDGETITPEKLREITWQEQYVFLRVSMG